MQGKKRGPLQATQEGARRCKRVQGHVRGCEEIQEGAEEMQEGAVRCKARGCEEMQAGAPFDVR
jgi:hypothetical protein